MKKTILSIVTLMGTIGLFAQHNYDNQNTIYSLNDNVGIRNTSPNATLDVKRGNAPWGTAVFRGTNRISHFNYSTDEHTYIRGGKTNSNVFLNDNGGNVGIRNTSPNATLDVKRGNAPWGTAVFRGTNRISHFNYSTDEHTYIRGGKANSNVFLNDNGGNVGIGTTNTRGYKLAVNGSIRAKEIVVEASPWPDYVFRSDYKLPSLNEVKEHIKSKGHLPNIPNEKEVYENGVNLGAINAKLLQKIEELTLYTIQQDQDITELKKMVITLQKKIK